MERIRTLRTNFQHVSLSTASTDSTSLTPLPTNPYTILTQMHLGTLELLAEHDQLHLIVNRQDTGASDTTENVGSGTLEQ